MTELMVRTCYHLKDGWIVSMYQTRLTKRSRESTRSDSWWSQGIARRNQNSHIESSQVPGWKEGHPEIQTFPGSVLSQQVIDPGYADPGANVLQQSFHMVCGLCRGQYPKIDRSGCEREIVFGSSENHSLDLPRICGWYENRNSKLPTLRGEIRTYSLTPARNVTSNNPFRNQLPNRVIIALLRQDAFNGDAGRYPFSSIKQLVRGEEYPYETLELKYDDASKDLRGYQSFLHATGSLSRHKGNMVQASDWGQGKKCTLFVFDNTANGCLNSSVLNPKQNGEFRIVITFGADPGANLIILVYGEFENLMEADRNKTMTYDVYQPWIWRKWLWITYSWIIWPEPIRNYLEFFTGQYPVIDYREHYPKKDCQHRPSRWTGHSLDCPLDTWQRMRDIGQLCSTTWRLTSLKDRCKNGWIVISSTLSRMEWVCSHCSVNVVLATLWCTWSSEPKAEVWTIFGKDSRKKIMWTTITKLDKCWNVWSWMI